MKRNIFLILSILGIALLFNACETNDPILIPEDTSYVSFSNSSASVAENGEKLTIELYLTTQSQERAEFELAADTAGLEAPAEEGTDFEIPESVVFENGYGYAEIDIMVHDDSLSDGKKQFVLKMVSGPEGYQIGIDGKDRIMVTIEDDEHPLAYFNGDYEHAGTSFREGSDYTWTSSITADPDHEDGILISNIGATSLELVNPVEATVDTENNTITIPGKQVYTAPNSNGYPHAFNAGNPDNNPTEWEIEPLDSDVVATYSINEDKTNITITLTNWGIKWIAPDGSYDGWWWWNFYVTSTMTKQN